MTFEKGQAWLAKKSSPKGKRKPSARRQGLQKAFTVRSMECPKVGMGAKRRGVHWGEVATLSKRLFWGAGRLGGAVLKNRGRNGGEKDGVFPSGPLWISGKRCVTPCRGGEFRQRKIRGAEGKMWDMSHRWSRKRSARCSQTTVAAWGQKNEVSVGGYRPKEGECLRWQPEKRNERTGKGPSQVFD